ncbi:MAG: hypothetical protein MRY59_13865 [Aquisalinus sp.]|nr:hypothetical protein [Aquisalinus sp.]
MAEEKQTSENKTPSPEKSDLACASEKEEAGQSATQRTASAADFLSMHAAHTTGETYTPSDEELKQRNKRSLAIAGGIVAFMLLVFTITVLRIGGAAG